ncbi:MAG: hypothetical protein J5950_00760 [Clostridia bacterium]|nr:hypothetical protein [Clostridia bacterium]
MKKRNRCIVLMLSVLMFIVCALSACSSGNNNEQEHAATDIATEVPAAETAEIATMAVITVTPEITAAPTAVPEPTVKGDHSGGIVSEDPVNASLFVTGSHMAYIMTEYPLAIQFYATTTFDGLKLSCHNGNNNIGTVVFSLYEWTNTYEETVAQEAPLETATFVDYTDNDSLYLKFSQVREDGEYLLVVTTPDPAEGVGVWYLPDTPHDAQHVFFEDVYNDFVSVEYFILCYTKTPKNLYGPLSQAW